jgi:hypothetical protein
MHRAARAKSVSLFEYLVIAYSPIPSFAGASPRPSATRRSFGATDALALPCDHLHDSAVVDSCG